MMPTFDTVIDAWFEIDDGMLVSKDGRPIPTDFCGVPRSAGWCVNLTSGSRHCLFKIKVERCVCIIWFLCCEAQPLSSE